jgi:glycosyltransferase involved in cell wall biosynthesis
LRPDETVFYIHGAPSPTFFTRRIIDEGGTHGALYIGVSEYIRSRICEMGVPEERAAVVYNGVNIPEQQRDSAGEEDSFPPTIGIVGQIGIWKGHGDLVEALRLLREENLEIHCVIVGRGDDDYEASLRGRIERYGLSGVVEWRGFVQDTDDIYYSVNRHSTG